MSETRKQPTCYRCMDAGYSTNARGRWADAVRCGCRTPCPSCDGTGRLLTRSEQGRVYVAECECWSLDRRVKMFQAAHLPSAYHNKRLEDFDTENETQSAVVRWLQQFQSRGGPGNRGVLIVGEPGVGKTHLICAVLRFLLLERGLRCRYVDSFALLSELKATWEAGTGSSALMEDVCGVPILGLDELGKTRTTGWQREVLDQIISRRYDSKLTTFVVTNYGLRAATSDKDPAPPRDGNWKELLKRETLDERIGPRIYSRLMEMCRAFYVTGADRRLGAGQ